jgi:glycosyltransferase involved in cell wall biosynthesis
MKITAVIPAYNEEESITEIVKKTIKYVDEVVVIDDGGTDKTSERATEAGARVIREHVNRGVLYATQRGLAEATGDIIVTLDADGQHNPEEIPQLIKPILDEEVDLVMGKRPSSPFFSERVFTALTNLKVPCGDACTGFRAIRRDFAQKMDLHGSCLCGTFVLEGTRVGARVATVPISIRERQHGDRKVKTEHIKQFFWILYDIFRL